MKELTKVFLIIAIFFASTFVIIKLSGVLTLEQIEGWLLQAKTLSPVYVGSLVAALLFADLFIAIPTLTITILAGYFLGPVFGAVAALTGMLLAGVCGYGLSVKYGGTILQFLVKNESKRIEVMQIFQQHGFAMILLARALPILPESSACLAGMTKMKFGKFLLAWLLSALPYALIAAYAGSISSVDNPKPAIFAAIGLSGVLWSLWFVYHRLNHKLNR